MRELNLIPVHIRQKRQREAMLVNASAGLLAAVLILAAIAYIPYSKLIKLNQQEVNLKSSIENSKPAISENEKLRKETSTYKQYVDLVERVQKSNIAVFPALKSLEQYIPQNVIINNLSYNSGSITINASAKDYNSISEFAANLQESKEFANGLVTNISKDEKTGENTFTLIIIINKGEVK